MRTPLAAAVTAAVLLAAAPAAATTPPPVGAGAPSGTANTHSNAGLAAGKANCIKPLPARANNERFKHAPKMGKNAARKWTLQTNCGQLRITLQPNAAPENVNNIKFLTKRGYFDRTKCHRLTTEGIYVLQCGDPAGDGTGGPGYTIPDENFPPAKENNYPAGTVAMANAGPGTAGSQFFIVYKNTTLPSAYTIIGRIDNAGLRTVQKIARGGAVGGTDGPPRQPVTIVHAWTS